LDLETLPQNHPEREELMLLFFSRDPHLIIVMVTYSKILLNISSVMKLKMVIWKQDMKQFSNLPKSLEISIIKQVLNIWLTELKLRKITKMKRAMSYFNHETSQLCHLKLVVLVKILRLAAYYHICLMTLIIQRKLLLKN